MEMTEVRCDRISPPEMRGGKKRGLDNKVMPSNGLTDCEIL